MITISTRNFEITENIDGKIKQNLEKHYTLVKDDALFDVHLERTTNHHKKGDIYRIQVTVKSAGKIYNAEAHGENLFEIIDEVSEKISREIKDGGEKKRVKDRTLGRKVKDVLKSLNPWG